MQGNNFLEVLSPVGDTERFNAALKYGADAVYLGRKSFGMRSSPMNFDYEQLISAVNKAHEKGVKVYLTCNTLPRNNEIPEFQQFIEEAVSAKVDAVIVADIGLMALVKKFAPDMEIHMSTQTGIVNYVTATALTIKGKKSVSLVMDAVAAVGTINALWGIMQIFGAVPTNYGSVVATVPWDSTDKINAASGLSQSPLFLAMVLGISLVTVLSGAVLCEKKARRVIYAVSGCIMSFVLIFTYSVAGWIAFGIAVVTSLILVFTKKVPKKRLISIACAVLSSALAIQLICFGVGNIYDKYKLHDGPIMWWDSWYRIEASGDYNLPEVKDSYTALDDVSYVYKYTFGKTIDIIKENALVGTGPENLIFPQVNEQIIMSDGSMRIAGESGTSNEGTFDKVYNEFLYVAATRGIPSLIAFVVLLVSVLAKGIGKLRKNKCGIIEIFSVAAVIGGIGVMLAGVSNITFAPVFWICAGLCAGNASAFKLKK